MTAPLESLPDGVTLKLERAREHLESINAEVRRLLDELNRNAVIMDHDPTAAQWVWRMNAKPSSTAHLSVLVGDFVHNLRSVLDHVVWELTDPQVREQRPLPEFPIHEQPGPGGNGSHETGIRKIWSLPIEAKVVIERLQPYQGGNEPLRNIQRLDNIDKHRRLLIVAYGIHETSATVSTSASLKGPIIFDASYLPTKIAGVKVRYGRFEYGDVIVKVPDANSREQAETLNPKVTFQIALEEERIAGEIISEVTVLYEFVKDKVLPQFAPFFSRHALPSSKG